MLLSCICSVNSVKIIKLELDNSSSSSSVYLPFILPFLPFFIPCLFLVDINMSGRNVRSSPK